MSVKTQGLAPQHPRSEPKTNTQAHTHNTRATHERARAKHTRHQPGCVPHSSHHSVGPRQRTTTAAAAASSSSMENIENVENIENIENSGDVPPPEDEEESRPMTPLEGTAGTQQPGSLSTQSSESTLSACPNLPSPSHVLAEMTVFKEQILVEATFFFARFEFQNSISLVLS